MSKSRKRSNPRKRQRYGYLIGLALFIASIGILLLPGQEQLSAAGPANTGHEELDCADCHETAIGTPLQQINSSIRYYLNMRYTPVEFVHEDVDNAVCMDCHDRANDQHPTYRFEEPRFKEARDALAPQYCESCHLEHSGVRVTMDETTFCVTCHVDIKLKDDPLDVTHAELAETEQWDSCLRCHDFHGNHAKAVPTDSAEMYDILSIMDYFEGGPSPYGDELVVPHLKERSQQP